MLKRLSILKTFSVVSSIQTVIVYLYVFFMARFAAKEEYANYMAITYIVDFTVAIALFGFNLLVLREKMNYVKRYFASFLAISLAIIFLVYLVYCVAIRPMPFVYVLLGFILIVLNYLYQMLFSFLIKLQKNKLASLIAFSNLVFILLSLAGLIYFYKLTSLDVLLVRCIQVAAFVAVAAYAVLPVLLPIAPCSVRRMKQCFVKTFPVGGSTVIGTTSQYTDKFILSTLSANAIAQYSVARFDIPFIGIFLNNMSFVYMEKIKSALDCKDYPAVRNILLIFSKYGWYFNVLFFTLLFCNSKLVISTLYSPQYESAHILFRIILLNYLLRVLPYTNVIISMGLERIIMRRLLIEMALQVVVSLTLLHLFGLVGLASSLGVVLLFWSVPYNFYYIAKAAHTSFWKLLPLKSMLTFFAKCFLPCYLYSVVAEYVFHQDIYSTAACIVGLMFVINFKEVRFLYANTK